MYNGYIKNNEKPPNLKFLFGVQEFKALSALSVQEWTASLLNTSSCIHLVAGALHLYFNIIYYNVMPLYGIKYHAFICAFLPFRRMDI